MPHNRFKTDLQTRSGIVRPLAIAVAGCLGLAGTSFAQPADDISIEVSDCIELDAPEERLACFEARVDDAVESRVDDAVADSDRRPERDSERDEPERGESDAAGSNASSAAASAEARFGFNDDEEERDEPEELFGTIAELRERLPNRYIITLENGQVWRQMQPQRYHLTEGLEVRIYSTRWGESYRLTAEKLRGFIQVERVR